MGPVAQFERDMVHLHPLTADEIDTVMIRAAAEESEEVAHPVADLEAEHIAVKTDGSIDVGDVEGDVAKLVGRYTSPLEAGIRWLRFDENLDLGAFRVRENQGILGIGLAVRPALGRNSVAADLFAVVVQLGPRWQLESKRIATRLASVAGGGVHHWGFEVEDFDAAVADMESRGYRAVQKGSFGATRFNYYESDKDPGVITEIVYLDEAVKQMFESIRNQSF